MSRWRSWRGRGWSRWSESVPCFVRCRLLHLRPACRAIFKHRETLLKQMYHLLLQKEKPGDIIVKDITDEPGLHGFLHSAANLLIDQMDLRDKYVSLIVFVNLDSDH